MLLAKLRGGAGAATARMALEMATLGGAACLGRTGELGVLAPGAVGDVAVWSLTGPAFAGAIADPVEAWLRCGPIGARDTIVRGRRRRRRRTARAPRRRRSPGRPPPGRRTHPVRRVTAVPAEGPPDWSAMHPPIGRRVLAVALRRRSSAWARGVLVGPRGGQRAAVRDGRRHRADGPAPAAAGHHGAAVPIDTVAMVGDSITVGSQEALEAGFATLGLDDAEIDAESGRRMIAGSSIGSGLEAVEAIAGARRPTCGSSRWAPTTWPTTCPTEYAAVDRRAAGGHPGRCPAGVGRHVPRGLPRTWRPVQRRPAQVLAARGHATVVDWASVAAEDGVLTDGVHPSGFGVAGVHPPRRRRRRQLAGLTPARTGPTRQ